jgi:hypothetical protein
MSEVRILKANVEDDDITDQMIIRGVLDQETLKNIHIAWYQRESGFSDGHINEIIGAYFEGKRIADITIGMRGQRIRSKGDTYALLDKCFCIDGGQRLYAAAAATRERPDLKIHLGVKGYLGTNEEFENDLFCQLGTTQVKVGPSILLRNKKKKSTASALLQTISANPDFALKERIAWDQRKSRHELMMGFSFAAIVGALHSHLGSGLKSYRPYDLLNGLDAVVERIGQENVQTNCIRFFDTIDKCWSIRQLSGARSEARPHLKPGFLKTLARLFSRYTDFWDGDDRFEFYCGDKFIKRLRSFPMAKFIQPTGNSPLVVYELLRKHLQLDPHFEMDEAAE